MPRAEGIKSRSLIRACTECQRRKSKCSGIAPCSFCSKTERRCLFDTPPERTSLTRKNLDLAELRCKHLEALLRTLKPDVDLGILPDASQDGRHEAHETLGSSSHIEDKEQSGNITPLNEYEWHEPPPSNQKDSSEEGGDDGAGMALESKPFKSGYLGSGSGSSLLEAISALLPFANSDVYCESPTKSTVRSLPSPRRSQSGINWVAEADMGSKELMTRLIDAYFVFYNTSYPILHKKSFMVNYQNRNAIPSKSSWHLIYYIVLAIGQWVLSKSDEVDHAPYYTEARSRLSMRMLESGTLGGVEAFLLMGNYLQKRDRPNTGYNLIGIAYRMALGLGIHRELPRRISTSETLSTERRRQVWWVLYCFDSGFSLTTGRPVTASDAFIDSHLPQNIDDTESDLTDVLPTPVDYPTTYSAIIAQAKLAVIANKIYNSTLSASTRRHEVDDHVALELENELEQWRASLPQYFYSTEIPLWFRGPRAVVLWKEQNLRLMLWHGGQCWHDKANAADRCQLAAIEVIKNISIFCKERAEILHMGLSWYAIYFLFQAVLVLNVRVLQPTEHSGEESISSIWNTSIVQARECLSYLGETNCAAKRCIAVLDRMQSRLEMALSQKAVGSSHSLSPLVAGQPTETTPDAYVQNANNWTYAADPGLQYFLGDATMSNLFDGLEEGFPLVNEDQYFGYIPGNLYNTSGI